MSFFSSLFTSASSSTDPLSGASASGNEDELLNALTNAGLGAATGGISTAVDAGTGGALSGITAGLTSGIGTLMNNTIGSVLANGLNFSCWNSTFTPQNIKPKIQADLSAVGNILSSSITLEAFQRFILSATYCKEWAGVVRSGYKSCSQRSIDAYGEAFRNLKETIKTAIEAEYNVKYGNFSLPADYQVNGLVLMKGHDTGWTPSEVKGSHPTPFNLFDYPVSLTSKTLSLDSSSVANDVQETADGTLYSNPKVQQSGITNLLLLSALGGGLWYYLKNNKNKKRR